MAMAPKKIINFSSGPAKIPDEVLMKALNEFLNYEDSGLSILEMSHRSESFGNIIKSVESSLRELLEIPDNYTVLFMQAGGAGQFAAVPLNLLPPTGIADYLVTGSWSKKAVPEGEKYGQVNLVVPDVETYTTIPPPESWRLTPDASYVFYCDNETIEGVEFDHIPETNGVPLVCDMSSSLLTKRVDISKYGIIFAGTQKNMGCAGCTVVIVKNELLGRTPTICPSVFDYKVIADHGSLYNTPPSYSIYLANLVLDWMKSQGGLKVIESVNIQKSNRLYKHIDDSNGFYRNPIEVKYRSRMNVVFRILDNEDLETKFAKDAGEQGIIELKGHRSVGGLRVSLYNGITLDDVDTLISFMIEFQKNNSN